MKNIQELLKNMDLFGETPQLYTNQTTQYQKELGGIFSLLVLICAILAFVFFGEELWMKRTPTVNQSIIYDPFPDALNIDFKNLDFFLKLQDPNNMGFINPSIYRLQTFISFILPNGSFPSYEIDMEPCKNSTFTEENLELFYPYNFTNSWCISRNQTKISNDILKLQGSFGQIDFHMLTFKLYVCENTTSSSNCTSSQEINKYLQNAYLGFYTIDNYIQTNNFTYPNAKAVGNFFLTVSKNYYTSTTLFYDTSVVTSDVGIVYSINEVTTSFNSNPLIKNINLSVSSKFATFTLQLSNTKKLYFRKYMKVQETLAQVGGIVQFLKVVAVLLYTKYNQHYYFQDLFNTFFSFKSDVGIPSRRRKSSLFVNNIILNKINEIKNIEKSNEIEINANNINDKVNDGSKTDLELSKDPQSDRIGIHIQNNDPETSRKVILDNPQIRSRLSIQKSIFRRVNFGGKRINFSNLQAFFGVACCLKKGEKDKLNVFNQGKELLKEKLNVTYLLKAYLDIEKLKYILMSREQLILFELIENPKVDLNLINEKSMKIDTLGEFLLNKQNLKDYDRSEIDKIFEKVLVNEDVVSRKILLAHYESI